jgi:hypothetical protein
MSSMWIKEGNNMSKVMNHAEYMKKTKSMSTAALRHTIKDASNAIKAMPDGENVGYYTDEIHYCNMELRRRNFAGRIMNKPKGGNRRI